MEGRVWRFGELVPSPRAFLDCTLPGHVRTLLSALGAGADDEQLEGTAVEQAVNYHIDFVKAPPGNGAALHSHGSEETFVALTGRWEIYWGDDSENSVVLEPFDGIVVPDGVLRGFRNVSETEVPPPHHPRCPQRRPLRLGGGPPSPPLQPPRNHAYRLRDARRRLTPTEDSPGRLSCRLSGAFPASRLLEMELDSVLHRNLRGENQRIVGTCIASGSAGRSGPPRAPRRRRANRARRR